MKNDSTTTILNFVLATTIILGVVCDYFSIERSREQRGLASEVYQTNSKLMLFQSLVGDVSIYNQQAKSPEVAHMVQTLLAKAAPTK